MNSRVLLSDLIDAYENEGNKLQVNCNVSKIIDSGSHVTLEVIKALLLPIKW